MLAIREVWPALAKFRHFGKMFVCNCATFQSRKWKNLKNNLAICIRVSKAIPDVNVEQDAADDDQSTDDANFQSNLLQFHRHFINFLSQIFNEE